MSNDDPVEELSALDPEVSPPPALRAKIVGQLRERGLVRSPAARRWIGVAAAAVLTLAAFAGGRYSAGVTVPAAGGTDRYMLLLYGEVRGGETELVSEYARWARTMRTEGRQMTGERLDPEVVAIGGADQDPASIVRGYFVFTAATRTEALEVARSHPHVRRGGRVVLRRISTT
jgi:hypothetical protein